MRYFIDLEFHERGPSKSIIPISIGIVSEDGHQFYGVNSHYDWSDASPWLVQNVKPYLSMVSEHTVVASPVKLRDDILHFIADTMDDGPIEFWGYYSDYDWVVFCQMYGVMAQKPDVFPFYCRDLRQWLDEHGYSGVSQNDSNHNALDDAMWIRNTFLTYHEVTP